MNFIEDTLGSIRDFKDSVLEAEFTQMIKTVANLRRDQELLRASLELADHFTATAEYTVKYQGVVEVGFTVRPTASGWQVLSRSISGGLSEVYPTQEAALGELHQALEDPEHELVKDHLS